MGVVVSLSFLNEEADKERTGVLKRFLCGGSGPLPVTGKLQRGSGDLPKASGGRSRAGAPGATQIGPARALPDSAGGGLPSLIPVHVLGGSCPADVR